MGGHGGVSHTYERRILGHLYSCRFLSLDLRIPRDLTQAGMVDALDIQLPHVSTTLRKLEEQGLVEHLKGHADNVVQRVNGYRLTSVGLDEAMRLESSADITVIEARRDEAYGLYRLGRSRWRLGKFEQADGHFIEGMRACNGQFPDIEAKLLIELGKNYYDRRTQEGVDTGIEYLQRAIGILKFAKWSGANEELLRARSNLGIAYRVRGDFVQGLKLHEKVIADTDNECIKGHGYIEAAYCLALLGKNGDTMERAEEAKSIFEGLENGDMVAGYWRVLGVVKRNGGDLGGSLECLEKALKLNTSPKEEPYYNDEIAKTMALMEK